jgi:hypothetical protein
MTIVSTNALTVWPGHTQLHTGSTPVFAGGNTVTSGQYQAFVFQAMEDMVITKVGVRIQGATGSPTVTVAIHAVDATTGLIGADWNTTVTTMNGGAAVSAATFYETTLANSATVSQGEFFAIKFTYASGTNFSLSRVGTTNAAFFLIPYLDNNGAKGAMTTAYAMHVAGASGPYRLPNVYPISTITTATFSTSDGAGTERGLRINLPFGARITGARVYLASQVGGFNIILRNDAFTELNSTSVFMDPDISQVQTDDVWTYCAFNNYYDAAAGWYRVGLQPTSTTNTGLVVFTAFTSNAYLTGVAGGIDQNYFTYTTAGGPVDTATDQFPLIDLLLTGIDTGGASGGHIIGG